MTADEIPSQRMSARETTSLVYLGLFGRAIARLGRDLTLRGAAAYTPGPLPGTWTRLRVARPPPLVAYRCNKAI